MEFYTLASGSSGNSTLISCDGVRVLVDAGISCRKITTRLQSLGLGLADISGIFITHTHADHIQGLNVLVKRWRGRVYASRSAADILLVKAPNLQPEQVYILEEEPVAVGRLLVTPFPTSHDAPGSMGFHFAGEGRRFAIATDLGWVPQHITNLLDGVHAAILEANHDPDWLRDGPYPYHLQQRILGQYGHLSNEDCGELAVSLVRSGARLLVLGHLSAENNAPERAYGVVSHCLAQADCGPVQLWVAPRDEIAGPFPV